MQVTLDLMFLKTLEAMKPVNGYSIARRNELVSSDIFSLNQGTFYAALQRFKPSRWIGSDWDTSDTVGRLMRIGQKQLAAEQENWSRIV